MAGEGFTQIHRYSGYSGAPSVKEKSTHVENAIEQTVPRHHLDWKRCLWELTRRIVADVALDGIPALELRPFIVRWHCLCPAGTPDFDVVWEHFQFGLPLVRIPYGSEGGILDQVRKEANVMQLEEWTMTYSSTQRRLTLLRTKP